MSKSEFNSTTSQVYFDPNYGYYTLSPVSYRDSRNMSKYEQSQLVSLPSTSTTNSFYGGLAGIGTARPRYPRYQRVPLEGFNQSQQVAPQPIASNPNLIPQGLQVYGAGNQATAYQRPTAPTAPVGTGFRPQFDPSFIQQIPAQRGNQAARPPAAPTLTPGAAQTYGGYQGTGGIAALQGIASGGNN